MRINSLSLKNFKCFESLDLDFAEITLLTGKNSSGKSSLIDAILAVFQSEFPFYLSTNGRYIEMGDFSEIAFNHDREKEVCVDISIGSPKVDYKTCWVNDLRTKMPSLSHSNIKSDFVDMSLKRSDGHYSLDVQFEESRLEKDKPKMDRMLTGMVEAVGELRPEVALEGRKMLSQFIGYTNLVNFSVDSIRVLQDKLSKKKHGFIVHVINQFAESLKTEGRNLNYIGSFRIAPERTYYRKTKITDRVNRFGENCVDQLLEWKDQRSEQYRESIMILRELGLLRGMIFRQSRGGRFEPRVRITRGPVWSSLVDVGFGISQLLPILVADLQMSENSTLIVDQPEMHLHPSAQANLADYFVKQVNVGKKRYILETHSEYLLNRIRASIVKGVLRSRDVSVYYFENSDSGSKYYKIKLEKNGRVVGAPKGFFDTYQMEVMDIAMNI